MEEIETRLKALMTAAQGGDGAAYERLLAAVASHLRGFFRRRLSRDLDSVEDLVQETLLALHNQRHTYEPSRLFTPWVHAIAKYKLIDYLRRSTADVEEGLPDDDTLVGLGEEADAAESARRDLAKLLSALPPRFRLPIEHVKLEGLSVQEAAARTGMSVSAVKIGIHRGLKVLARNLSVATNAHG